MRKRSGYDLILGPAAPTPPSACATLAGRRGRGRHRAGFTLFELLIALVIVVILVGVMASTITIAFRAKNSAEDAIEAVRDTQAVGDLIVMELSNAAAPTPSTQPVTGGIAVDPTQLGLGAFGAGGGTTGGLGMNNQAMINGLYGPFIGTSQSVAFFTTGPEPKAPVQGDAKYIEYSVERTADGQTALIRRVDTNLLADSQDTSLPQETLITRVQQVVFTYWDGTQWLDSWDSTLNSDTLPTAVKIELTLDPIRTGGQERLITRVASLWCAAPAATQDTSTQSAAPGLGG